ncbi:MAG TPA: glycosyltransferase family 39 protein [Pyrinomonadaceae bacterium]
MRFDLKRHFERGAGADLRKRAALCLLIFLLALGVRLMTWQDARHEAARVQKQVSVSGEEAPDGYKHTGRLLLEGGVRAFFDPSSPLSEPDHAGHPLGYPVLIALALGLYGDPDEGVQMMQIVCDALAAVVLFLIAAELLPLGAAVLAGLLAAVAPQLAWNSVLLLPDTISVLPILLAFYCILHASKRGGAVALALAAGVLVGVSCWLRPNGLLLAPFLLLFAPVLFGRGRRVRCGLALVGGALLVIAPLTIRNAVVFGHFIPLSLGAGQTLLEGIADYDKEKRFGIPETDLGIMTKEAEEHGRPDYRLTLFGPDGVRRERMRVAWAARVIRENPFWFAGVMVRRAGTMFRLERTRLLAAGPAVTRPLNSQDARPSALIDPSQLFARGSVKSPRAETSLTPDGDALYLRGDESKYDAQFVTPTTPLQAGAEYVFKVPVKVEEGRVNVGVYGERFDEPYVSTFLDPQEGVAAAEQPTRIIDLPFVTAWGEDSVRLVVANGASNPVRPVVRVGALRLYELGPASKLWTRHPRLVLRAAQRLYITAVFLPLYFAGAFLLVAAGRWRVLLSLLAVPAYFFCVQSAVHTEYRYVMAIHYFFFILAAVALHFAAAFLWRAAASLMSARAQTPPPATA